MWYTLEDLQRKCPGALLPLWYDLLHLAARFEVDNCEYDMPLEGYCKRMKVDM